MTVEEFEKLTGRKYEKSKKKEEKRVDNSAESGIIKLRSEDMALEYQRYGRNKDTVINHTYINSGEYRNKFDKITDNKEVNKVLYSKAKEMLKHRSGTLFEDMYWIDGNTGEVVASILNETQEECINYTAAVIKKITNKNSLIAIHTHPNSMPPSIADFNAAAGNGYKIALIACHNGRLFIYTSNEKINMKLYDMYVHNFISDSNSEYDAQIKALEKLKENYDIDFWEV